MAHSPGAPPAPPLRVGLTVATIGDPETRTLRPARALQAARQAEDAGFDAALRRAADVGDGWIGYLLGPASFARRHAALERHRADRGRADRPFTTGCSCRST